MLPNGWRCGQVSDLIERLESGVSVNGEDRPKLPGEIGVLKVSAVSYGYFDETAYKTVIKEDELRAKLTPKQGQIIISRSNTDDLVGASAYIEKNHPDLYLCDKLWQTVPRKNIQYDSKWLAYLLGSSFTRNRLSALASGTSGSMKNISKDALLNLTVNIPSFTEQKKITKILAIWDHAISTTEKLLANSQQQKKALMQFLLTGKLRLNGFSGIQWKEYRLGKLFNERIENNQLDLPLVSITREQGVIWRDDVGRKDTSSEDKTKYLRICPGDIGYNTMRMWQGVSALSDIEGLVSPAYTVITPKHGVDGVFMSYLFKLPRTIHNFYRYSQGLTSDTWNLKFRHFKEITVTIPELEEQKQIAKILQQCDREIAGLTAMRVALVSEKKVLMQQLLTGKRRVKVDES